MQPALPPALTSLATLARNLRWAWHDETRELFSAIDPDLWVSCGNDPLKLLAQVSDERLDALAADRTFMRHLVRVEDDLNEYLEGERWYQTNVATDAAAPKSIGYFSAEFGLASVLPQYSGGLGILAGDHLKAASDLGVPIIGVGLLYHHGYFSQSLDASGWQQERYPVLDPNEMPLERVMDGEHPLVLDVAVRNRQVSFAVWLAKVGRVPLLMLDTNLDENVEDDRLITDRLYGGGSEHRLAQEVLLGIGGVRAVRAYTRIAELPEVDVYHCNEGHAGFLGLERIREYMNEGDSFDTALTKVRAATVFTTHTPVPAGIDRFATDLVIDQFKSFDPLPLERVLRLGQETYDGGDPTRFNMAVMGLRLAQRANGVSQLHGEVSREMFAHLWPGFDTSEVPIGSVTNGVHHFTWMHPELLELMEARTADSESVSDGVDWSALDRIDDQSLWTMRQQMRGEMVSMARERLAVSERARGKNPDWTAEALSPTTLTIGFARRGASYKRLTLMLSEPDRLKGLLNHPDTPIQIVIAGKAHPADEVGKGLIQEMVQFADGADVRGKIVFLPDYDMSLAAPLYPGCDVWLNNPIRPNEACGTSGMKAALNGVANLSIMDGWWDELYDPAWGWQIPSSEGIVDEEARDRAEARALYEIIEDEIIPRFYTRDSSNLPRRWVQMIRETISGLGPKVLASRMVRDYVTELYQPAAASAAEALEGHNAEDLATWTAAVRKAWPAVSIGQVHADLPNPVQVGSSIKFSTVVQLGSLRADDVEVQLVVGDVDSRDVLHDMRIYELTPEADVEGGVRFSTVVSKNRPGSIGYTVRVVPRHIMLASPAELGLARTPQGN